MIVSSEKHYLEFKKHYFAFRREYGLFKFQVMLFAHLRDYGEISVNFGSAVAI